MSRPLQPDIHGTDIELAPTRRSFQEHDANPGLEVIEYSTLEVVRHNQPAYPQLFPSPFPSAAPSPSLAPLPKAWNKLHGGSSTSSAFPATTPEYSAIDFSSPFDQRPLVVPPVDGNGGGGTGGTAGNGNICGVRRQLFWVLLAVAVFLAVVGIAVGVGVGVGLSRSERDSTSNTTNPSSSSSPSPTRSLPLPLTTSSSEDPIACPQNNLTLYAPRSDAARRFLLLCGRDYNSNRGTADMYNAPTGTMADCIELCSAQEGCVGAGWGKGVCWLKSRLAAWHDAPGWYFAVEDIEANGGG